MQRGSPGLLHLCDGPKQIRRHGEFTRRGLQARVSAGPARRGFLSGRVVKERRELPVHHDRGQRQKRDEFRHPAPRAALALERVYAAIGGVDVRVDGLHDRHFLR